MAKRNVIDGFGFTDPADLKLAEDECKRIKYIAGKMNMDNPESVLAVYDKLIAGGIFVTPIGYEYLRTLQNYLYKCPDITDDRIKDIPVAISYTSAMNARSEERRERMEEIRNSRRHVKTFRKEYVISICFNIILFIAIIAMFVITLKADNPNMINYREAIINQYAEWEQDLTERENAIKEKEKELSLGDFTE